MSDHLTLICAIGSDGPNECHAVIPAEVIKGWELEDTVVVRAAVEDTDVGERKLMRRDEESWIIELPEGICREAAAEARIELNFESVSTGGGR